VLGRGEGDDHDRGVENDHQLGPAMTTRIHQWARVGPSDSSGTGLRVLRSVTATACTLERLHLTVAADFCDGPDEGCLLRQ